MQGILHSLDHMEMGITAQHDDTPHEDVRTLSCDAVNVSKGFHSDAVH
jgi:hypothetical protein